MNWLNLPNNVYDKLKYVIMYILPELAFLYLILSGIWGLPFKDEIVSTITAVNAFIGICLGISSSNYNKDNILK